MSFPRLGEVVHHDGFGGPARFDPTTLQFPVRADVSPPARGGELYGRSLLHGNLQRESSRPVGPQRVKPIMYCVQSYVLCCRCVNLTELFALFSQEPTGLAGSRT